MRFTTKAKSLVFYFKGKKYSFSDQVIETTDKELIKFLKTIPEVKNEIQGKN